MESRDLSRHSNSLSRNFKDFSLSPDVGKKLNKDSLQPKPARAAKNQ